MPNTDTRIYVLILGYRDGRMVILCGFYENHVMCIRMDGVMAGWFLEKGCLEWEVKGWGLNYTDLNWIWNTYRKPAHLANFFDMFNVDV